MHTDPQRTTEALSSHFSCAFAPRPPPHLVFFLSLPVHMQARAVSPLSVAEVRARDFSPAMACAIASLRDLAMEDAGVLSTAIDAACKMLAAHPSRAAVRVSQASLSSLAAIATAHTPSSATTYKVALPPSHLHAHEGRRKGCTQRHAMQCSAPIENDAMSPNFTHPAPFPQNNHTCVRACCSGAGYIPGALLRGHGIGERWTPAAQQRVPDLGAHCRQPQL